MPDIVSLEVRTPIRLGQFIKLAGLAESGADGTELITAGEVTVDGEVCTARGRQLTGDEIIEVSGIRTRVVSSR